MENGERGTVYAERGTMNVNGCNRTQPDAKWNATGCYWSVSGRNANDGRTQKERVRVKNDIFTVICSVILIRKCDRDRRVTKLFQHPRMSANGPLSIHDRPFKKDRSLAYFSDLNRPAKSARPGLFGRFGPSRFSLI